MPKTLAPLTMYETGDTNLYRAAVGILRTDGSLRTGGSVQANQGTGNDVLIGSGASGAFRGISFINDAQTAWDVNLYRSAAGVLRTDGGFVAAGNVVAYIGAATQVQLASGANAGIAFGSAADTNLYRNGAASLKTDGSFYASTFYQRAASGNGLQVAQTPDANPRIWVRNDGYLLFGDGTATVDTYLYRYTASILKTDGRFDAAQEIYARSGGLQVALGLVGPGSTPGMTLAGDTNLYRMQVDTLRTDDQMVIGTSLYVDWSNGGNRLWFGSAADTGLYRSAAGTLSVVGTLIPSSVRATADLAANYGTTNQVWVGHDGGAYAPRIMFGNAYDCYLYRAAAFALATDGEFRVLGVPGTTQYCNLYLNFKDIGLRYVRAGAPDSAVGNAGFRSLMIAN
jgi:hypothetical protein